MIEAWPILTNREKRTLCVIAQVSSNYKSVPVAMLALMAIEPINTALKGIFYDKHYWREYGTGQIITYMGQQLELNSTDLYKLHRKLNEIELYFESKTGGETNANG